MSEALVLEIKSTRLAALVAQLEPDAVLILERIAERLVMGRKQYGDLNLATDRRDFRKEAIAEALDMSVYLASLLEAPAKEE